MRSPNFSTPDLFLFHKWSHLMIAAFGVEQASVYITYALATKYHSMVFEANKFFPLLNLLGERCSGKTTVADALYAPFAFVPAGSNEFDDTAALLNDLLYGINLGSVGPEMLGKAIVASTGRILVLDEFNHDLRPSLHRRMKAIFDGAVQRLAGAPGRSKCGAVICGQHSIAPVDPALQSRCIRMNLPQVGSTTDAIWELNSWQKNNLGWLYRATFPELDGYTERVKTHYDYMVNTPELVADRQVHIAAALVAMAECWSEAGYHLGFDLLTLRQTLLAQLFYI